MDANKNGKIEFQEFLEKMAERNERNDMSEDLRNVSEALSWKERSHSQK